MMFENAIKMNSKKKKQRKSLTIEQLRMLEEAFERNANWSSTDIEAIAERTQVSRTKVYKWNWDRKRKEIFIAPTTGQS